MIWKEILLDGFGQDRKDDGKGYHIDVCRLRGAVDDQVQGISHLA